MNEISPVKLSGITGAFSQIMLTVGMSTAFAVGFAVPYSKLKDAKTDNPEIIKDTIIWRMVFLIPGFVAFVQFLLMIFVFRLDSPKYYEIEGIFELVQKSRRQVIYPIEITMDQHANLDDSLQNVHDDFSRVTYREIFTRRYRCAVFVGCTLCMFNQLCGANPISFFSFEIFSGEDYSNENEFWARVASLSLGIGSIVASVIATIMLKSLGRRTIIFLGFVLMSLIQISLAV